MTVLKKYNLKGEEIGSETLEEGVLESKANTQMIKDYLVAIRNNKRQWSANTKGRKEVNHSEQKPHPQKGTGRARQGFLGAPQYKGGGIVFGPKPKWNQHIRINKKERRKTIRFLLSDKISTNKLRVIDWDKKNSIKKTKQVANCLKALQIYGKRILVLGPMKTSLKSNEWRRCMKNISRTQFVPILQINGYDLAVCQEVLLLADAFDTMKAILKHEKVHD